VLYVLLCILLISLINEECAEKSVISAQPGEFKGTVSLKTLNGGIMYILLRKEQNINLYLRLTKQISFRALGEGAKLRKKTEKWPHLI
jgi:hypothetical protein